MERERERETDRTVRGRRGSEERSKWFMTECGGCLLGGMRSLLRILQHGQILHPTPGFLITGAKWASTEHNANNVMHPSALLRPVLLGGEDTLPRSWV